jgi:hypothetical protein
VEICAQIGSARKPRCLLRTRATVLFAMILALFIPGRLQAGLITLNASSNADLSDTTGNGTFTTVNRLDLATHGLYVTNFVGSFPNFQDRAVILFNLAALPTNSQIQSLTFNFQETAFANAVGTVAVNGFSSNGTITLADATASGSQLGTYDAIGLGLGNHSVTLSPSFLQSILGSTPYLGIRLQGTQFSVNTSLGSIEQGAFFSAPTLTVSVTPAVAAPEPASLILLGLGLAGLAGPPLCRRASAGRRRTSAAGQIASRM